MSLRFMLEPERTAPEGWIALRNARDMLAALLEADSAEIIEISMRCSPDEAVQIVTTARRVATSAFHLLGGFAAMQAIHFHDPDIQQAHACMRHPGHRADDCIGVSMDVDVPIGGQSKWQREKGSILLAGTRLPDTATAMLIGGELSRLVTSPMLENHHRILGITHDGWNTIIELEEGPGR